MVEIIGELGARRLLARRHLGADQACLAHMGPQPLQEIGILGHALGDDVARAFERGLHIRNVGREVTGGALCGIDRPVGKDRLGQRAEPRSRAISALVRRFGL